MAGRYPPAWLDELRARADIVQVISGYVQLKRNGANYWGLCPFHGEKTASFSVNPAKQFYYCFGCKAGGSVIQFIMDIERLDFGEAVQLLAERTHLSLPQMENDEDYQRRKSQKERLLSANREAAQFYHQTLFTEQGRAALDYLKGRGLSDSVIRRFGLGAAPERRDVLTQHLLERGYTLDELTLANLTVVREAQPATAESPALPRTVRDMFRGRAMFPIIDQGGNVLAFGGRVLGQGNPKYLNSSDTPVFNKRYNVYAANLLRKERQLERVILVEGYMDVVSLTQFGVRGVVATLGTALTTEQARLMKRYAPKIFLSYDGDSAGQHAILRGLDILAAEGIPARVLDFPDGLDPDEFIRRDGLEGFERLPAISPETYRLRRLREGCDMSTQEGRTEYAREAMKLLRHLDPVELENHLREIAIQTGFSREVLLAQWSQTTPPPAAKPAQRPEPITPRRTETGQRVTQEESASLRAQEELIALLATGQLPLDIVTDELFEDGLLREMYQGLKSGQSAAALLEAQATPQDQARAARILQSAAAEGTDELLRMAQDCVNTIRRSRLTAQRSALQKQINTLSGPEKAAAIKEVMRLDSELRRL